MSIVSSLFRRFVRRFAPVCVAAWVLLAPRVLLADDTAVPQAPQLAALDTERAPSFDTPQAAPRYASWLTLGYVLAPLIGGGALVLSDHPSEVAGGFAVAGLVLAVTLPAIVHAAHGQGGRAFEALLGWPLLTLGGVVLGGLLGAATHVVTHPNGGGDIDVFIWAAVGGLIGGSAAAIAWATYDVTATLRAERKRSAASGKRIRFALAPHPHGVVGSLHATF